MKVPEKWNYSTGVDDPREAYTTGYEDGVNHTYHPRVMFTEIEHEAYEEGYDTGFATNPQREERIEPFDLYKINK